MICPYCKGKSSTCEECGYVGSPYDNVAGPEETFVAREGIGFISPDLDEEGDNEGHFSWSPCECCGSHLGGQRYAIVARHIADNEIYKYVVCTDCYMQLCG